MPKYDVVLHPFFYDKASRQHPLFDYDEATADLTYFHVRDKLNSTVRDAIRQVEVAWSCAVTIHLYDKRARPQG